MFSYSSSFSIAYPRQLVIASVQNGAFIEIYFSVFLVHVLLPVSIMTVIGIEMNIIQALVQ